MDNNDIEKIYNFKNDLWGLPQEFRGIKFFPMKLKDVHAQDLYYKLFQFPKNFISQKDVIKSSYLKYLLLFIQQSKNPDGREIQDGLIEFLKIITRCESVLVKTTALDIPGDLLHRLVITIGIDEVNFSENDFDIIREIILRQNGLSTKYIEEYNPELEKFLGFVNNKFDRLTFEDEITLFSVMMQKSFSEIEDYTIYQFRKSLERLLLVHNFDLYSPLEVSGQIKSKDGSEIIKHYFSPLNESSGRYSSILIEKNKFLETNPFLPNEDGIIRNSLGNIK